MLYFASLDMNYDTIDKQTTDKQKQTIILTTNIVSTTFGDWTVLIWLVTHTIKIQVLALEYIIKQKKAGTQKKPTNWLEKKNYLLY